MPALTLWLLAATLAAEPPTSPPRIVTAVGTSRPGYSGDGGPATSARLNHPFDVALDAQGNLYLSDTFNHCIRKVDARSGTISTVAGDGTRGVSGDGGPATKAHLDEPYGIVLARNGDLYFADRLNRRVRRVDARTGVIATVAGDGSKTHSGDDGPAIRAGLVEPNGLALSLDGQRLYVADVADHRVRVVDLGSGTITTFAGTGEGRHEGDGGPARRASVFGPRAVEVGPDGTVYVLERQGNTLRAVNPQSGVISTVAGTGAKGYSGDGGPALRATFNGPKELAVDGAGNLYIVDTENQAVRRIDARSGTVTTLLGPSAAVGQGSPPRSAQLARPHGVAVAPGGTVYIGDTENHRVQKVVP